MDDELKQRLKGKLYLEAFKLGALMTGLDPHFDSTKGNTTFLAIEQFLNEAKKDFPYVENYVDTEDDELRHEKINKWFKKWFGDSS